MPKRWHEIRRWAALPDVRLHDLRHSFASVAINDGVPLVMIGRLLGHALPETTARYAHLEDGSVQDSAARVSRSLSEALEIGRRFAAPESVTFLNGVLDATTMPPGRPSGWAIRRALACATKTAASGSGWFRPACRGGSGR